MSTSSSRVPAGRSPYGFKDSPYSSHALILEHAGRCQGRGRVLDIGGGEGFLSARLHALGHQVTCVAEPGSVADDFPRDVEVVEADLDHARPALPGRFDLITCGDVLEHLKEPEMTLQWMAGLLTPSGVIVGSLPNGVHLYVRLQVLMGRFPKHDRGLFDRTHVQFYSLNGWRGLFQSTGFSIKHIAVTPVPFSLLVPAPLGAAMERLSWWGAVLWKQLLAYQFVVVATRETSV